MESKLITSLESSPVINKNGYQYFVNPLTDGVPLMNPEVLREVIDWMLSACDFDCDVILAPESMGIPLAVPLSLELGIPYSVIRKRQYGLPGEVTFQKKTGYSGDSMSINGIPPGSKVVIVDDVISTGGTLDAIISAIKTIPGVSVTDVLVPINKNDGREIVLKKTGIPVKTMVNVVVSDGKVKCLTG